MIATAVAETIALGRPDATRDGDRAGAPGCGRTVPMITHDARFIRDGDRVVELAAGQVVGDRGAGG